MEDTMRIGTLVGGGDAVRVIPQIIGHGFESFSLTFWQTTGETNLTETAARVRELAAEHDFVISSVGIFGNPLTGSGDNADTLASWERLIDHAHLFGTGMVSGFTGRLTGQSIDESIPKFTQVFGELSKRAADRGVRIAFENCSMGGNWDSGDWNIAHNPTAWEKMFNAVPADNLGLEWEPCHQMVALIDPSRSCASGRIKYSMSMGRMLQSPGTLSRNTAFMVRSLMYGTGPRVLETRTGLM